MTSAAEEELKLVSTSEKKKKPDEGNGEIEAQRHSNPNKVLDLCLLGASELPSYHTNCDKLCVSQQLL